MKEQIISALKASQGRLTRDKIWAKMSPPITYSNEEYVRAEQSLVDEKRIERRTGRNGGIYLLEDLPVELDQQSKLVPEANQVAKAEYERESTYYQPILNSLLKHWTEQPGFKQVFGAITAGQGSKQTGGKWSRPDIVLCAISDWLFSSRPEGDVRTFEVKRFEVLDVLAVYEAVSHKSRSHYAYLIIANFPDEMNSDQKSDYDDVLSVAAKHGIGVITVRKPEDWSSWDFELNPGRSDADHQAVNQLLLDQVPPNVREAFRNAMRTTNVTIQI